MSDCHRRGCYSSVLVASVASSVCHTSTSKGRSLILPRASVKNVVLTGFGHVTLLDLDTIDLSNLNRQFLFRKKDVKQSKALVCPSPSYRARDVFTVCAQVAARTASAFNPAVEITPIHANIKEPQFDIQWFKQFDIVLNALDNLGAPKALAVVPRH